MPSTKNKKISQVFGRIGANCDPSRCGICPNTHRCVGGDGVKPNKLMFIGEAPGREEDWGGRPFIGRAGDEFNNHYLGLAGLDRDDIYITNTMKCRPTDQNKKPSTGQVLGCSSYHIPGELDEVEPDVVVLMGATACSMVPDIDLELEHGIPRYGELFGREGLVVPMFHPAAGMHDPSKMIPLMEDFKRLGKWLQGDWVAPSPVIKPDYRLYNASSDVMLGLMLSMQDSWARLGIIGIDTETHGGEPWSLQFSIMPGRARMIRVPDTRAAQVFRRIEGDKEGPVGVIRRYFMNLAAKGTEFYFHNADQDLDMLHRIGIDVPEKLVQDTMKEAYHTGRLPQKLKHLGYRLLGERMRSWEDVVTGPSKEYLGKWIADAERVAGELLVEAKIKKLKKSQRWEYKKHPMEGDFRRIQRHLMTETYKPWEQLETVKARYPEEWELVAYHVGEMPKLGIDNAPIDEAVHYGCQDADVTLRVAVEMRNVRRQIVDEINVAECDWD